MGGGAERVREQRTWCVSTSESAPRKTVHELAEDVRAFVDGKAGTEVEVNGSAGVLDVVEALKRLKVPNVTATGRGTENRKGARLDVGVVVRVSPREGPKEVAMFSGSVDVVPTRRVAVPAVTEIGGLSFVDMGAQRWTAQNVDVVQYNDSTVIPEGLFDVDGIGLTFLAQLGENECAAESAIFNGTGAWMYLVSGVEYTIGTKNRLYTMGVRNRVCPAGWRMPTEADWMALIEFVRAELQKSGKPGTDAEVWAELREGKFKAVMAGFMNDCFPQGPPYNNVTAWMIAHDGRGEPFHGAYVKYWEGGGQWDPPDTVPTFSVEREKMGAVSIRLIALQ
jgi:uncharacterized protein (TIGR02145 family)